MHLNNSFSATIITKNNNFDNGTPAFKVLNSEEDEYIKVMSLRTQLEMGKVFNYSIYLGPK